MSNANPNCTDELSGHLQYVFNGSAALSSPSSKALLQSEQAPFLSPSLCLEKPLE